MTDVTCFICTFKNISIYLNPTDCTFNGCLKTPISVVKSSMDGSGIRILFNNVFYTIDQNYITEQQKIQYSKCSSKVV